MDFQFESNEPIAALSDYETLCLDSLPNDVCEIPLLLDGIWRYVGEIDLRGDAEWDDPYPDEFMLYGPTVLDAQFQNWKNDVEDAGIDDIGPFGFAIAPDAFGKRSGGGIGPMLDVPSDTLDAQLSDQNFPSLGDYVRNAIWQVGLLAQPPDSAFYGFSRVQNFRASLISF